MIKTEDSFPPLLNMGFVSPINWEADYFHFAKYISIHAPVSRNDAEILYTIATLNGYTRDDIIQDLVHNDGNAYETRRKMFMKMELHTVKTKTR